MAIVKSQRMPAMPLFSREFPECMAVTLPFFLAPFNAEKVHYRVVSPFWATAHARAKRPERGSVVIGEGAGG